MQGCEAQLGCNGGGWWSYYARLCFPLVRRGLLLRTSPFSGGENPADLSTIVLAT